ncbi:hypothetical protein GCM10007053_23280 [Halioglobus pacificus]|uniref:Uncharacterized protein n=1 Tax=Parahalioglobus pacificus TaxID=930806 RepID=A0A918XK15_9GAMM|nr:hypothetical protein GCM10007053_23280 [Halioglobus pacificus]
MPDAMLSLFWPEGMIGLTYADMETDATKFQGTMDLIYQTKDGYITAGAGSNREGAGMCRALDLEPLIDDERFSTAGARFANPEERKTITAEAILAWDADAVLKRLDEEGVPCAPLLSRMELMRHEQIIANDSIQRLEFADFGEVRQARPAAQFDKTPASIDRPAPQLGEHTREVLQGLGYSGADISQWAAAGKIGLA